MNHSEAAAPPSAAPPAVRRLLDGWHGLEKKLTLLAYLLIAALLVTDVLGRELLAPLLRLLHIDIGATGVYGSQKISLYTMIFGAFLGLGIATATGTHLLPRVGFGWIPASWAPIVNRIADVLTGVVLCTTAWYAVVFVLSSRDSGMLLAVLDRPAWLVQIVIPIGILSAALRYFFFAVWPDLRPTLAEHAE